MPQPPLNYYSPPRTTAMAAAMQTLRRVRRICGVVTLAAFIVAGFNSGDRNPLQWWGMLVFMGCLFIYLFMVAAVWFAAQLQAAGRAWLPRRVTPSSRAELPAANPPTSPSPSPPDNPA